MEGKAYGCLEVSYQQNPVQLVKFKPKKAALSSSFPFEFEYPVGLVDEV